MSIYSGGYFKANRPALWYQQEDENLLHKALLAYNDNIATQQVSYVERCKVYLQHYSERKISGFDGNAWLDYAMREEPECNENILRSAVNTFVSNYAANQPRIEFISKGEDWLLVQKAIRLTKAVEGIFKTAKAYTTGRQVMRDGAIFGTGCWKIFPDHQNKRVAIERVVAPSEIRVDFLDGKYMLPRTIIQHKIVPREAVFAMAESNGWDTGIVENSGIMPNDNYGDSVAHSFQDPVTILEAWHLPSSKEAGDGKHVFALSNGIIGEVEEWTQPFFPFVFFRYMPAVLGFWGEGISDDTVGLRNGYVFMNEKIQHLLNMATTRAWLPMGADITAEQVTNNPDYTVNRYAGPQPPVFVPDPSPTDALFLERDRFKASMYESSGISQMNSAGVKPAGLDSRPALRTWQDVLSKRFADTSLSIDEFWVESAGLCCWAASEMSGVMVNYSDRESRVIDEIKWSDVSMQPNEYSIEKRAASQLSDDPAGRRQDIADLMDKFPQLSVLLAKLFKDPDVDFALSMLTAPVDVVTYDIEQLEKGENITPDPNTSPQIAIPLVLARINRLKTKKVPKDIIENMMNYLSVLVAMQTQASQPGMGAGPVMGTNQQFTAPPSGGPQMPPPGMPQTA